VRYRTIVADPPWRYTKDPGSLRAKRDQPPKGRGRQAEDHYPTMTTEEIAALPITAVAEDNAHLYLWVTNPLLTDQRPDIKGYLSGPDIARAWGFEPKTVVTWVKKGIGPGWYFRGATEHIIFAVRGDLPIPAAQRERNWFEASIGAHSEKPDAFYDLVERVSPGPYLELFSRRARLGDWHYWGNESLATAEVRS
jgi:N6-adenosine-specific RNA methylase IME4